MTKKHETIRSADRVADIQAKIEIDIAINMSCMVICSPRWGGNQGEVVACIEKTGTLQSVNNDRVVHEQSIA